MHHITQFQDKKSKNFPSPDLTPSGEEDTPPHTPLRASILAPTAVDTRPLSKVLDPPLDGGLSRPYRTRS